MADPRLLVENVKASACIANMCRNCADPKTQEHAHIFSVHLSSISGANVRDPRARVCVKDSYVTSASDLFKVSINACAVMPCSSCSQHVGGLVKLPEILYPGMYRSKYKYICVASGFLHHFACH